MKVLVRIPTRTEHEMHGRRSVGKILRELGMNPESVIVIKGDELLTLDRMVEEADEIEVRPAISGG
jgi:sulfur carrier protein